MTRGKVISYNEYVSWQQNEYPTSGQQISENTTMAIKN
jgi:hypothetical protein